MPVTRSTHSKLTSAATTTETSAPSTTTATGSPRPMERATPQKPVAPLQSTEAATRGVAPGYRNIREPSPPTQRGIPHSGITSSPLLDEGLIHRARAAIDKVQKRSISPLKAIHPPETRSKKSSSRRSTKSVRRAQIEDEILELKIRRAENRLAMVEAESDTDEETIASEPLQRERVQDWVEEASQIMSERRKVTAGFTPVIEEAEIIRSKAGTLHQQAQQIQSRMAHLNEEVHIIQNSAVNIGNTATEARRLPENEPSPPHPPIRSAPQLQQPPLPPPMWQNQPPLYTIETPDQIQRQNPQSTQITGMDNRIDLTQLATAIASAAKSSNGNRMFAELPVFAGAYQEWLSFRAAYVETQSNYSDYENLTRLRRSLRGRAREAVESLLIYSSGPHDVLKTLESRFGRPDAIAMAELERLKNLPRPTDSARDVCIFATKVGNIITTLRALDRAYYLFNPEVTKITIEKLTPTIKYRWYDFAAEQSSNEPDLLKLARFLEKEANRCAPYAQPESTTYTDTTNRRPTTTIVQQKPQYRSYVTNVAVNNKESKIEKEPCDVCSKIGNVAKECYAFTKTDSNGRWNIAREKHLCYRCLQKRTPKHSCPARHCAERNCRRTHHPLLHFDREVNTRNENTKNNEIITNTIGTTPSAYLKIIPVQVAGPQGKIDSYALLDDGSTITIIDEEIAQRVGARGPASQLDIEAIGNTKISHENSRIVTLKLKNNEDHFEEIKARTISGLKLSPQKIEVEDLQDCTHLEDIRDKLIYNKATPTIIIGQDNWHLLLASETRRGRRNQPVASKTALGWVLHGSSTSSLGARINTIVDTSENIEKQLRDFFAIESLMINPKTPNSDPEKMAQEQLEKNTSQRPDGHYETGLIWKIENVEMPNNRKMTENRLFSIERKIEKDPEMKKKYHEQMKMIVQKGYAEEAPIETTAGKTWYLPHFAVLNKLKPEKLRIVHDAAAKTCGVSLNDHLLTGPDLLQSLPGVLMRFRQAPIAVTADIREMFMQVKIREEDRDALRYLWRGTDNEIKEYRMTSLIFGATCSPTTAIYVKNLNALKNQKQFPEACDVIINKHYVDDYLASYNSNEQAIEISKQVQEIQLKAHYELRGWKSNSPEVQKAMGENSKENEVPINPIDSTERVLGMVWDTATDGLKFNLNLARLPEGIFTTDRTTKRKILKIVMSLYDPLGLISPITSKAKQILQDIWKDKTDWDEEISEKNKIQWEQWLQQFELLKNLQIPRCYLRYSSDDAELELHTFVDASEAAYAAALYWRVKTPENVYVTLIAGKSRVSPVKLNSIPRLELQAAVLGARMASTVIEEHEKKPQRKYFWTDSKTALQWIRAGARSFKPFVAHRIAAIEELTKTSEWRWVPSTENVADDATREVPTDFNEKHRWFRGPAFLNKDKTLWPEDLKIEKASTGEEKLHTMTTRENMKIVPDSSRFSKWEKYVRATARVLQFIQLLRRKSEKINYKRTQKNKEKDPDWRKSASKKKILPVKIPKKIEKFLPIPGELMKKAEDLIIRTSQDEAFAQEKEEVRKGQPVNKNSRLYALAIEEIDGLIRIKSRIDKIKEIPYETKHPIVLDGNHRSTRLYIEYLHRRLNHASTETVVNECRERFFVLRLRPVTKTIVTACLQCRKRRSTPVAPATGNHPESRLAHHRRPFTFIGVDYLGPLTVTVGRSTQKRYVALFTCLTTRAVHLELVGSLTTDAAVMALRRFIARRGCPSEIWSDNGTNFVGADKELRESINRSTQEEASKRSIRWKFIPPGAPFMGGAWERMVGGVKKSLSTTLQKRHPHEETLLTLLAEAEYTVNSRPLTHVSVSAEDPEAITPNHFLLGGSAANSPPGEFDDSDLISRNHWRASQRLADHFWQRWVREYLPDLQNRRDPHSGVQQLEVGDIVIIADSNLPRNTWPLGRIVSTFPGPDNIVRAVDVKTKAGVLRRPAKKLVKLHVEAPSDPARNGFVSTSQHGRENVQDKKTI